MESTSRGDDLVRLHGKLADCLEGEHKPNAMFTMAMLLGQLASEREGGLDLAIDAVKQCHAAQLRKNKEDENTKAADHG